MPYAQGELDGLCGIYAIVNAVEATVSGWNKTDAAGLFQHLIACLSLRHRLDTVMTEGLGIRELCRLIDLASTYLADEHGFQLKRRMAFGKNVPLSCYWRRLQNHLQDQSHTAIIGLWGRHEHWSCAHGMTKRTVRFADSGWSPISRVYRANCTTGRTMGRRYHELVATQTVFIELEKHIEV